MATLIMPKTIDDKDTIPFIDIQGFTICFIYQDIFIRVPIAFAGVVIRVCIRVSATHTKYPIR